MGALNVPEWPEPISAILGIHANGRGSWTRPRGGCRNCLSSPRPAAERPDIIAEVLIKGDMEEAYRVTSELLPRLADPGRIQGSQTFVVKKSPNGWLGVPKGAREEDAAGQQARG